MLSNIKAFAAQGVTTIRQLAEYSNDVLPGVVVPFPILHMRHLTHFISSLTRMIMDAMQYDNGLKAARVKAKLPEHIDVAQRAMDFLVNLHFIRD
jgi:hypothetical protein